MWNRGGLPKPVLIAMAVCPLLSGPRTFAVYSERWDRAAAERLGASRAGDGHEAASGQEPPSGKQNPPSGHAGSGGSMISASVFKPADGDKAPVSLVSIHRGFAVNSRPACGFLTFADQVEAPHASRPPAFRAHAPPF